MAAANPNKALWEKGDFSVIAETMRQSGDEFVASLHSLGYFTAGAHVLDLGCGDGTTAFPLALRGAHVTGIDISAPLVAKANQRKQQIGDGKLNIHFQEGDACHLAGVPDNTFDLVVTVFGAMFAPKPIDVAKEMVRVVKKPGGRIVMGNWIPGDLTFVSSLLKISSKHSPPPPEGFISPMTWGVEETVIDRFQQAGVPRSGISFQQEMFHFHHSGPPAEVLSKFEYFYGPTMNAFAAAKKAGTESLLRAELTELFTAQNTGGEKSTVLAGRFLRVTVTL
jgi:ubiquinone/menaquinone biosynthesis C-methylase UbiE